MPSSSLRKRFSLCAFLPLPNYIPDKETHRYGTLTHLYGAIPDLGHSGGLLTVASAGSLRNGDRMCSHMVCMCTRICWHMSVCVRMYVFTYVCELTCVRMYVHA